MTELLLLHGAIGSSSQLLPLSNLLTGNLPNGNLPNGNLKVSLIDFIGHGARSAQTGEFSIEIFANDVLSWMEERNLQTIDIFGYSMGGYVALYLAKYHPKKVNRIFTLATKFRWTPEIAANEIKMLDPRKISEKVPAFAKTLAERHSTGNWKEVLQKTALMMTGMGEKNVLGLDDFRAIHNKVLISIGDRDKMVTLDETLEVYKALPYASLLVLPETSHPIEQVNMEILTCHIHNFFA